MFKTDALLDMPASVWMMDLESIEERRPAERPVDSFGAFSPCFWEAVGRASASLGSETFYDRLLDVVGALVPADLLALVRYSSFAAPDLVIPRENRPDVEQPYNAGLYASDPFYQYWQAVTQPAVTTLRMLAKADLWESRYAREFLHAAHISDEIAIFLPPIGGATPTLVLDRADGDFTEAEVARIQTAFPLLAGLHKAHIDAVVSRGVPLPVGEKPLRIVDRCGRELAANPAWERLAADPDGGLSDALAVLAAAGRTQVSLPDGRVVTRSPLAADFGAAPEGMCDEVEMPTDSRASSPFGWMDSLTPRERQIVELTLEGHPIAGIAKRLGLQCGTIKNHRLRLYQKLDITTERELFLTHMRHMHRLAA
jgi:DNA-binding CsgD family transcriptional regulator